jgi:hypothetical protein
MNRPVRRSPVVASEGDFVNPLLSVYAYAYSYSTRSGTQSAQRSVVLTVHPMTDAEREDVFATFQMVGAMTVAYWLCTPHPDLFDAAAIHVREVNTAYESRTQNEGEVA